MSTTDNKEEVKKNEKLFFWGMLVSMFCWGLSWASGKVISHYADAGIIGFYRFVFTFISMFFVVWLGKIKFYIQPKAAINLIISACLIALYSYSFFQGLSLGQAGAGGVLVTILNPIISYLMMLGMKKRFPTSIETLGLLLGLAAGVVLLKLWGNLDMVFQAGNSYFLLAALTWAILSLFTSKASQYGSPVAYSFWMYGLGALIMLVFIDRPGALQLLSRTDMVFWGNMFFSATITTAFATTFFFVATTKIGASKASSFIFLVPFSATLGSWLILSEAPTWNTLVGGVIGIAAVLVLNRK